MSKFVFVVVLAITLAASVLAQQPAVPQSAEAVSHKREVAGFVEQQYRPFQDFGATSLWLNVSRNRVTQKYKSDEVTETVKKAGLFSFSQVVTPIKPGRVNYWQVYGGPFVAADTKVGYVEGGVAVGAEAGGHVRFAEYGFFAPKKALGVTVFAIHEHGTYKGSAWTRAHIQKPVTKGLKVGYHHQTYLGDGVNVDWKIGRTPFSFFGALTRYHGKTKSMAALRFNF